MPYIVKFNGRALKFQKVPDARMGFWLVKDKEATAFETRAIASATAIAYNVRPAGCVEVEEISSMQNEKCKMKNSGRIKR